MSNVHQPFKILWILEYYNGIHFSLQPFYAFSEEDVEQQIQRWIERQLPCQIVRESLRAFPGGFKFGMSDWPGKIPTATE